MPLCLCGSQLQLQLQLPEPAQRTSTYILLAILLLPVLAERKGDPWDALGSRGLMVSSRA